MRTDSMKADSIKADSTRTDNMKADSMTIDNTELNSGEATKEQTGQTPDTWQAYTKKTHVIGRTVSIITLVMLVGAPFLIGKLLGAYPDLDLFLQDSRYDGKNLRTGTARMNIFS